MNALRRILIGIAVIVGILIVGGIEGFWSDRGTLALLVTFLAAIGGIWAAVYSTRNEAR